MMKNDDSHNHVLTTQGMSRSHQGHPRRSLDVFWCIWHVFEIFHFFVRIMIFTHHDSRAPGMISHANSCAPGGECFAPPLPHRGSAPSDDSQNHVLDTQGVSWSHQGHPRRSLDVFWCIWHVFEIFHFLSKI